MSTSEPSIPEPSIVAQPCLSNGIDISTTMIEKLSFCEFVLQTSFARKQLHNINLCDVDSTMDSKITIYDQKSLLHYDESVVNDMVLGSILFDIHMNRKYVEDIYFQKYVLTLGACILLEKPRLLDRFIIDQLDITDDTSAQNWTQVLCEQMRSTRKLPLFHETLQQFCVKSWKMIQNSQQSQDHRIFSFFVLRLLDYCREHFYLLPNDQKSQYFSLPTYSVLYETICNSFNIQVCKKINQLRNYMLKECFPNNMALKLGWIKKMAHHMSYYLINTLQVAHSDLKEKHEDTITEDLLKKQWEEYLGMPYEPRPYAKLKKRKTLLHKKPMMCTTNSNEHDHSTTVYAKSDLKTEIHAHRDKKTNLPIFEMESFYTGTIFYARPLDTEPEFQACILHVLKQNLMELTSLTATISREYLTHTCPNNVYLICKNALTIVLTNQITRFFKKLMNAIMNTSLDFVWRCLDMRRIPHSLVRAMESHMTGINNLPQALYQLKISYMMPKTQDMTLLVDMVKKLISVPNNPCITFIHEIFKAQGGCYTKTRHITPKGKLSKLQTCIVPTPAQLPDIGCLLNDNQFLEALNNWACH